MTMRVGVVALISMLLAGFASAHAQDVPIKGLGRFEGWRDNALIGYGLVVGLAGSGDSERSAVTRQALTNVYSRMGATVSSSEISSRNAAVVMVVAKLPASANVGDRIPVTVSSAGDARSLAGGTLLMTTLNGPDGRTYALAQGPLVAGGDSFSSQLNLRQRNYPTTARLEDGATVEAPVEAHLLGTNNELAFLLQEPSFTTASRIADAVNDHFGNALAWAKSADEVRIRYNSTPQDLAGFVSTLENIAIQPDRSPRVVINERTGTVVAGGDVTISSVVISQGDLRVTVDSESYASQPAFVEETSSGVRSLIITNTHLEVERGQDDVVATFSNTTVADLVSGLSKAKVDTRRMITILQAMRAAGALHAEIIVQ
jgi:flagellar P-ring protein precursor FlgI